MQAEFHVSNAQLGYLTSAFLGCYMVAAPFTGPLADRYSRKLIIVLGAVFWSGLTLLTGGHMVLCDTTSPAKLIRFIKAKLPTSPAARAVSRIRQTEYVSDALTASLFGKRR